ncbi:BnaC01g35050D [Brassica napus]|uniref:Auxin-responsive protein n=2 Tax=Brassica TaxID=3705 RepID=A0A078IA56_BRANA|nr:BnaC01g35050D [Brassica napus]VDD52245.1 unnamed protein product [Brassica oleracea]
MEISNSYSPYSSSSVNSTSHLPSESSVNLSLSFTSLSLYFATKVFFTSLLLCFFSVSVTSQDWPPITLKGLRLHQRGYDTALFVKVYMEGVPIGRNLENLSHIYFRGLVSSNVHTLSLVLTDDNRDRKQHVLTYQEKGGDWMMVGDITWDMFLETVRRLRITRLERC